MKHGLKKVCALVLALSTAIALISCGSSNSGSSSASSGTSSNSASTATDGQVYECVAALHTTAGGIEEQAVQHFADLLNERTNGAVVVDVFAGASLGTEQENLDQIRTGEVQFVLFGDVFLSQLLQDYNATSIPFVFNDLDSAVSYWESISDIVDPLVKEQGNMYIVGRELRAPRQLTAKKAIETPADLAGIKLRVP